MTLNQIILNNGYKFQGYFTKSKAYEILSEKGELNPILIPRNLTRSSAEELGEYYSVYIKIIGLNGYQANNVISIFR